MHGPGFIAHTHVQGARTFEENGRLWMELYNADEGKHRAIQLGAE